MSSTRKAKSSTTVGFNVFILYKGEKNKVQANVSVAAGACACVL